MTRFLVVVPTFNSGAYLDETLASLVYQTGPFHLRIHIQDGTSTDNTIDVAKEWQQRLPKGRELTWASEKDLGLYDAIRRGTDGIESDQIMTWLGSDDVLIAGTLATVSSIFDQFEQVKWLTGAPFVGTRGSGNYTPWPHQRLARRDIAAGRCDGRSLGFIMQEGTFWRASLWQSAGGIDPRYSLAGDWDLWRRFAQYTPLYTLSFPLARFTKRRNQKSQDMVSYYKEVDNSPPVPENFDSSTYELRRMPFSEEWEIVADHDALPKPTNSLDRRDRFTLQEYFGNL